MLQYVGKGLKGVLSGLTCGLFFVLCFEKKAAFGTVGGGLLSDRWLGAPPPSREQLSTGT